MVRELFDRSLGLKVTTPFGTVIPGHWMKSVCVTNGMWVVILISLGRRGGVHSHTEVMT